MNHIKPSVMDQPPYEALFRMTEPDVLALASPVLEQVVLPRDPYETEFHQAVSEVLESIRPVLDQHPEYRKAGIMAAHRRTGARDHVPGSVDG